MNTLRSLIFPKLEKLELFASKFREHPTKKELGLSKGIHSVKVFFMSEPLTVTYERVDDLPLLLTQLKSMEVQQLLDKHFPTHGNWQGLSLGWVASIWLGHILSGIVLPNRDYIGLCPIYAVKSNATDGVI